MKELRSKKYPDRQSHIVSDEEFKELQHKGIAKRFSVRELENIKHIIPTPALLLEVQKHKKKT